MTDLELEDADLWITVATTPANGWFLKQAVFVPKKDQAFVYRHRVLFWRTERRVKPDGSFDILEPFIEERTVPMVVGGRGTIMEADGAIELYHEDDGQEVSDMMLQKWAKEAYDSRVAARNHDLNKLVSQAV